MLDDDGSEDVVDNDNHGEKKKEEDGEGRGQEENIREEKMIMLVKINLVSSTYQAVTVF